MAHAVSKNIKYQISLVLMMIPFVTLIISLLSGDWITIYNPITLIGNRNLGNTSHTNAIKDVNVKYKIEYVLDDGTFLEPMIHGLQCDVEKLKNDIQSYEDLIDNHCVYNYDLRCRMDRAQNILFPNSNDDNHRKKSIQSLQKIKHLQFLVVGHHGGVQIDILSYLHLKLEIPMDNIWNYCIGSYCKIMMSPNKNKTNDSSQFSQIYWNEEKSAKLIDIVQDNKEKYTKIFQACCFRSSGDIMKNITLQRSFENYLEQKVSIEFPELIDQKWDVLICGFPGVQCLGWLKFAKSIILRFAHRYDHHLWNPQYMRVKWVKILNMIIGYCHKRNINIFVSNIYDYYYVKHSIYSKDENIPYLWPNFAHHFQQEFGFNNNKLDIKENINPYTTQNSSFYIYIPTKGKKQSNCSEQYLNLINMTNDLYINHKIEIKLNQTRYKPFMYDINYLQSNIKGFIIMPYAVHTAKWSEFYSLGMTLFFPSLKLWSKLNIECDVITDRQFGNQNEKRLAQATQPELYGFVSHSPCCKTNPYTNHFQDIWLPFSDYYNDKLFKYVIYYDDGIDLKNKIIEHYNRDKIQLEQQKQLQITSWNEVSDNFKYDIADIIYNGYRSSSNERMDCIPFVMNASVCIRQMKTSEFDVKK